MAEQRSLLPPVHVIHDELTRVAREERRLRELLKLKLREEDDYRRQPVSRDNSDRSART
jgi:hypothetical protein